MLIKMMILDYENLRRMLPASILFMAAAAILSFGKNPGTAKPVQVLLLLAAFILILAGLNRLIGSAMFGTEGAFRLLLPVDSKTRTISKALLGGLWMGLLLTVVLLIAAADYTDYGAFNAVRMHFMERAVLYLLSIGFSPLAAGISMAFIPVVLVLSSGIFCIGIMIVQIEINSMVFRRFKGFGLFVITLAAACLFGGLFVGLGLLLKKLVFLHLGGLWLVIVILAFLSAAAFLLCKSCARMMDTKMNLS